MNNYFDHSSVQNNNYYWKLYFIRHTFIQLKKFRVKMIKFGPNLAQVSKFRPNLSIETLLILVEEVAPNFDQSYNEFRQAWAKFFIGFCQTFERFLACLRSNFSENHSNFGLILKFGKVSRPKFDPNYSLCKVIHKWS